MRFHDPYFHDDNCNEMTLHFVPTASDPDPFTPVEVPRT